MAERLSVTVFMVALAVLRLQSSCDFPLMLPFVEGSAKLGIYLLIGAFCCCFCSTLVLVQGFYLVCRLSTEGNINSYVCVLALIVEWTVSTIVTMSIYYSYGFDVLKVGGRDLVQSSGQTFVSVVLASQLCLGVYLGMNRIAFLEL